MFCLNVCICTTCMHAWCLQRQEGGSGFPETEVIGGFEPTCGCWDLNLLREQPVLLMAESHLTLEH